MQFKKGITITLMSLGLIFGSSSVILAGETVVSMNGMGMGGSAKTQAVSAGADAHDSSSSGHEATPDMDPQMEGMENSNESNMSKGEETSGGHGEADSEEQSASGGHGEASGGHGEEEETSEGVNWWVVGGFLAINSFIILLAGLLKISKKPQPLV